MCSSLIAGGGSSTLCVPSTDHGHSVCPVSCHSSLPLDHESTSALKPHGAALSCLSSCNHYSLTVESCSPLASHHHSTSPHHGSFCSDGLLSSPETEEALHSRPHGGLSLLCSPPSCHCGSSGSCRPLSLCHSSSPAGENHSSFPSDDGLPTHLDSPLSGSMSITLPCSGLLSSSKDSGSIGGGPRCISFLGFSGFCSGLCSTAGFQGSNLSMPARVTPLTSLSSGLCKIYFVGVSI